MYQKHKLNSAPCSCSRYSTSNHGDQYVEVRCKCGRIAPYTFRGRLKIHIERKSFDSSYYMRKSFDSSYYLISFCWQYTMLENLFIHEQAFFSTIFMGSFGNKDLGPRTKVKLKLSWRPCSKHIKHQGFTEFNLIANSRILVSFV